jgi:mono/diheme cytochrome c family protein
MARYNLFALGLLAAILTAGTIVIAVIIALGPDTHSNLGEPDPNFNRVATGEIGQEQPFRPSFDAATELATAAGEGALTAEEHGRILYFANSCATCHGLSAGGATVGPELVDAVSLEDFFDALRDGEEGMPGYSEMEITDAEAEAIFTFLEGLKTGNTANRIDARQE